jgi:hypothetical protein
LIVRRAATCLTNACGTIAGSASRAAYTGLGRQVAGLACTAVCIRCTAIRNVSAGTWSSSGAALARQAVRDALPIGAAVAVAAVRSGLAAVGNRLARVVGLSHAALLRGIDVVRGIAILASRAVAVLRAAVNRKGGAAAGIIAAKARQAVVVGSTGAIGVDLALVGIAGGTGTT